MPVIQALFEDEMWFLNPLSAGSGLKLPGTFYDEAIFNFFEADLGGNTPWHQVLKTELAQFHYQWHLEHGQ